MPLRLEPEPSAAVWLTADPSPWGSLVSIGPAGFDAYGRLRFIPDPEFPGQREGDVDWERPPYDGDQWPALLAALSARTNTPADCYFCLWDGWPFRPQPTASPTVRLHGLSDGVSGVRILVRSYYLFRGALCELGEWDAGDGCPEIAGAWEPAFIWPADRAWCVANDVDPHYAGIAAAESVVANLIANPDLDVVPTEQGVSQPAYL